MGRWLIGFLWKDLKLFAVDRQALVMAFIVPVLIASILGWLDTSAKSGTHAKVPMLIVDQDGSDVSRSLLSRLRSSDSVEPVVASLEVAETRVRGGEVSSAAIIPTGFGLQAVKAMSGGEKPTIKLLTDPSKPSETQLVHGTLLGEASAAAAIATYGPLASLEAAPVTVADIPAAIRQASWSSAAHDYAGFGIQGLLFFAIEAAIGLARDRRMGIWRRLRSSPVPPTFILVAKGISSTVLALGVLSMIFLIGAALFGIRILGSALGFAGILLSAAAMAGSFGLLISSIGKNEMQCRAISILIILVMLATGGAWFPLQQMPDWVQSASKFMPVRWAVEGIDATTWRGLTITEVLPNIGALLAFAVIFTGIALVQFRTSLDTA